MGCTTSNERIELAFYFKSIWCNKKFFLILFWIFHCFMPCTGWTEIELLGSLSFSFHVPHTFVSPSPWQSTYFSRINSKLIRVSAITRKCRIEVVKWITYQWFNVIDSVIFIVFECPEMYFRNEINRRFQCFQRFLLFFSQWHLHDHLVFAESFETFHLNVNKWFDLSCWRWHIRSIHLPTCCFVL